MHRSERADLGEPLAPTPGRDGGADRRFVAYYGGLAGAFAPFAVFVAGVIVIALSGAPDERGFWPVLLLALTLGLLLARDRTAYCEAAIDGMSQPIVMIMIMAWLLASIIGTLLGATGFVEALTWTAGRLDVGSISFVAVTFLICCLVSTSTGTSFGTILICGPILYPAGGLLGADPPTLAGAILGGATFGDSISPISDTSIASALSQHADIAGTVRSRFKYVVIAAAIALPMYLLLAARSAPGTAGQAATVAGSPRGLPMLLVPGVVIALLLARRHLLHGLLIGVLVAVVVGVGAGLLPPEKLLSIDRPNFTTHSLLIDGINRGLGISVFTIFLLGLVSAIKAGGLVDALVSFSGRRVRSVRSAEAWIVGVVAGVVLLTCHSIVAILTVGEFARLTGERFSIHAYRRANLLDLTVSTFPFILPYFIPVLLAAGTTRSGAAYGLPAVAPLAVGLRNFQSWAVLLMVGVAVVSGFGRRFAADETSSVEPAIAQS